MRKDFWLGVAVNCAIVTIVFVLFSSFVNSGHLLGQGTATVWASPARTGNPRMEVVSLAKGIARPSQQSHIEQKVKAIIVEQLQVDGNRVTPNANFRRDLGADHLDMIELVMQFEQAFHIKIPDPDKVAHKIVTVRDAVDYIEQHLQETRMQRKHSPR